MKKTISSLFAASILFSVSACTTVDPLEPLNRKIFAFNMVLDKAIFRPVAKAYDKVIPAPVACGIGNFFDNIDDVTSIANNVLQFRFYDAWSDTWRVAFNTTFGLLGIFDVATRAGLPKHRQDFGLTLARYGFVCSSYLMIPFFGPSTVRDTVGWTVDWRYLSVWGYIESDAWRYGLYGLRLIHKRAGLLAADKLIDDSLDPYIFVRDAYLQKRNNEIKSLPGCCDAIDQKTAVVAADKAVNNNDDKDDTFVADDKEAASDNKNADKDDTFVAEGESTATKPLLPAAKSSAKVAADGDTFVEP